MSNVQEKSVKPAKNDRGANGRFQKGNKVAHRNVNIKHRATKIKQAFLEAFEKNGGMERMVKWIKKSPHNERDFYKMVINLLPKDLNVEGTGMGGTHIVIVRPGEEDRSKDKHQAISRPVSIQ